MQENSLPQTELKRRKYLATRAWEMIHQNLQIEARNENTVMSTYQEYYLHISFSEVHPLMVICLAKALAKRSSSRQRQIINELNLRSILGSHAINDEMGCYFYRSANWLDTELTAERFFEILNRCVDEANQGIIRLTG